MARAGLHCGRVATSLIIDPLFNGPDTSANGGYACGCMAETVVAAGHRCVRVNLRAPPPLGRPLELRVDAGRVLASGGERYTLVVVSEGAKPRGQGHVTLAATQDDREARLGGIGQLVTAEIEKRTGVEIS